MNREEWKAFHHAIRADTRAFRIEYGGWPCFVRRFHNAGQEWSFDRSIDRAEPGGRSYIWTPLANRPLALRVARIADVADYRAWGDTAEARRMLLVLRCNRTASPLSGV